MGILAETFGNFLFPSSIGDEMAMWSAFCVIFVFVPHSHGKDYSINAKIPMPFLTQRFGSGYKKSPQENSCGGYCSVAILLSI